MMFFKMQGLGNDYVYIDQTEFYCRIGGRREKIEFVRK